MPFVIALAARILAAALALQPKVPRSFQCRIRFALPLLVPLGLLLAPGKFLHRRSILGNVRRQRCRPKSFVEDLLACTTCKCVSSTIVLRIIKFSFFLFFVLSSKVWCFDTCLCRSCHTITLKRFYTFYLCFVMTSTTRPKTRPKTRLTSLFFS